MQNWANLPINQVDAKSYSNRKNPLLDYWIIGLVPNEEPALKG